MKDLSPVYARIRNYQSISDLEIEIKGFTCITGISNIGKSAIIRAISSSLLNAPVVGAVRNGERFCSVQMESDGWGFIWEKGGKNSGVNRYRLVKPAKKELDKIGQGQLEEIASMGFTSVQIGSKTIHPWLASQFEPIFLLNMSGPSVTDFISDISRLGILQDAIILNVRGKKKVLDIAKLKEEEAKALREKEQELSDLDSLLVLDDELSAQNESICNYERDVEIGEALDQNLKKITASIQILQPISETKIPEDEIGDGVLHLQEMYEHWVELESVAKRIIALRDITSINIPVPPEEIPQIVEIITLEERINKVHQAVETLSMDIPLPCPGRVPSGLFEAQGVLARMEAIKAEENSLKAKFRGLEKEQKKMEQELAKIPTCSTCKRPWSGDHDHAFV